MFVIDVVDEYGAVARPCSMHAIFQNAFYVPFGNILKRDYHPGEMIEDVLTDYIAFYQVRIAKGDKNILMEVMRLQKK